MRMEEEDDKEFDMNKKDFDVVLRMFKAKQTHAHNFILKASEKYKEAVFKLLKRFMNKEQIPGRMQQTTLHMIWKKKGRQEVMKNNRFIHHQC